jgi:hypothetical protein
VLSTLAGLLIALLARLARLLVLLAGLLTWPLVALLLFGLFIFKISKGNIVLRI